MPDSTDPATPAAPTEPRDTPSLLNEAQAAALTKTEEVCRIALRPEYLTPLTTLDDGEEPGEDDITEAGIQATLSLCAEARGKSASAIGATGEKRRTTQAEDAAETKLLQHLRFVQARARQKHFFKNPGVLREYGIGEDIDVSRAVLEQYAQAIHEKTATDKLPKVTEARRAELQTAIADYKAAQTTQTGASGAAGGERIDRDALVRAATAGRMQIQFAADAEWPHTDPANAPTRRQFQLPANRAYLG